MPGKIYLTTPVFLILHLNTYSITPFLSRRCITFDYRLLSFLHYKTKPHIMKNLLTVILSFCIVLSVLHAQTAAKSAYVELGGPGFASVNFDTRFNKREDGLGGRIGIGGFSDGGIAIVTLPVELNYLLGKDNKNYFEIGGGFTYFNGASVFDVDNTSGAFGHLSFGYRLQPKNGGFLFRAAIVPVLVTDFL